MHFRKYNVSTLLNGIVLLLCALLLSCRSKQGAEIKDLYIIGTDQVTFFTYITAGSISQIFNESDRVYHFKTAVISSGDSQKSISSLLNGEIDFAVVRSDIHFEAYKGLNEWKEPQTRLRSLFSLESESITLVVSANSGIKKISDIKGKRINLAPPASGQLQRTIDILEAFEIKPDEVKVKRDSLDQARALLEDGRLDGFFETLPHPHKTLKELSAGRVPISLISTYSPKAYSLLREKRYYAPSLIFKDWYPLSKSRGDIQTIGLKTTLMTTEEIPEEIVYALTREIFENLDLFKTRNTTFEVLNRESMLQGLSAPIHPGALKYYQEAGLVNKIDPALIP